VKASVLSKVENKVEAISSQGRVLGCPTCRRELVLVDLKDGDQGYWCMSCERGWRVGHLPQGAFYERRKRQLETV